MTPRHAAREKLAAQLAVTSYLELFQRATEDALDGFYAAPHGPGDLRAVAEAPDSPARAAFLAAEILFHKGAYSPSGEAAPVLAATYARALAHNYTGMANPWGMPGDLDGTVAQHLIALGEPAVLPLAALLDEDTPMTYGGSREAGLGDSYAYRVKDAAAAFIAAIRGRPWTVHTEPAQRDPLIAALKLELAKEAP